MILAYFCIFGATLVEFRPLHNKNVVLSMYNHFEHEQPSFTFVSDLQNKSLQGYYTKAMVYRLKDDKYSIQFDNTKMCYDEKHNLLFSCDVYYRCSHTNWSLQKVYDDNKVLINNNGHCIAYKNDKEVAMEPCNKSNLRQIFVVARKKRKMYCIYDENHSDELVLEV